MADDNPPQASGRHPRAPSRLDMAAGIGLPLCLLAASVILFGADSSSGPNQIALALGAALVAGIGVKNGHSWPLVEETIIRTISTAMPAILILLAVGSLIGAWILSGAVPTMIYYGLQLLDPQVFYAAACLLCAVAALAIGSSWTVAGTLGVALIGIAAGLGHSPAIAAGAIISGAYFGDKMSPLSDSTNLAPAVTGTDLFSHIGHMLWSTVPSLLLALVGFLLIGLQASPATDTHLASTLNALESTFNIHPAHLLPALLVAWLAIRRTPPVAAILAGALIGVLFACLFQRDAIAAMSADDSALDLLRSVWSVLADGYRANTGNPEMDALLSRGGMSSMLTTVWLILTAMAFGASLERVGILAAIVRRLARPGVGRGRLVAGVGGTCVSVNVLAADQYIAVVLPGGMYRDAFRRERLHPKNLSRILEDTGTLTSPLVPWNTCGAFMAATLGVPTLTYLPFCLLNLVNPVVSLIYGYTGISMTPLAAAEGKGRDADEANQEPAPQEVAKADLQS